ncbi:hypothetical protein FRC18_000732, partial [Serendipita sp. 400]
YDLSRFAALHPGGLHVLFDEEVAGQDATKIFYSLHRHEVLQKPSYARLQIGVIRGEEEDTDRIIGTTSLPGELSLVPYGEPTWLTKGYSSPYFSESHRKLQAAFRKFVDEIIYPDAQLCEENGKRASQSVLDAMAAKNIHAMRLGPGKHLKGLQLMDGIVQPEEFDYFHELVINQEVSRIGARGYGDGLMAGMVIGLPPVLNFGSEKLKKRVVPDIFAGKKFICLAISEAFAGSDVAGLKTTAEKTEDGSPIRFEQVSEIGKAVRWANQREVFGKPLFSQAVIRHKLAAMIARVESAQAWLENITYQMTKMTYKQQSAKLAGQIAFIKMYATRTAQETARDAVQIFGGRGISQKGMGRHIEHYHRTITFDSLLGGAEDVLGDLGVRQAIKQMPKNVRL